MFVSAVAAMFLVAAPPETAQPAEASAPATKAVDAKAKAPKRVCYDATPSGSRLPRKVCVTQSSGADKAAEKASEPK